MAEGQLLEIGHNLAAVIAERNPDMAAGVHARAHAQYNPMCGTGLLDDLVTRSPILVNKADDEKVDILCKISLLLWGRIPELAERRTREGRALRTLSDAQSKPATPLAEPPSRHCANEAMDASDHSDTASLSSSPAPPCYCALTTAGCTAAMSPEGLDLMTEEQFLRHYLNMGTFIEVHWPEFAAAVDDRAWKLYCPLRGTGQLDAIVGRWPGWSTAVGKTEDKKVVFLSKLTLLISMKEPALREQLSREGAAFPDATWKPATPTMDPTTDVDS